MGALVVVVALGLIFFYAGRSSDYNQEPALTTQDQSAVVASEDDAPERLSQDAEQILPDIEADLKEVDDALKTL